MKSRGIIAYLILVFGLNALALSAQKTQPAVQMVNLEHAETLVFDQATHADYQVLIGDVRFRHDSVWMYCDTAHYYQKSNSLYAFGNVRIEQGDTLFIYGKTLFYDGNRKLARLRKKVSMHNRDVALYTDHLDYDRVANIGYYHHGGRIVDSTNVLSSDYGQYRPDTKMAFFKDRVVLTHPQFVLHTDTLNYHTETRVASIVSPSIIRSDQSTIYANRGWYNTLSGESLLLDRSSVCSSPNHLIGDSVLYHQIKGEGKAYGHVQLTDSSRFIRLLAHYAYYNQEQSCALLTDSALLIEYSTPDTFYVHADTLLTRKDSIYDTFLAYYGVRCYRSDLQAVCDSIFYSTRDSVLDMNGSPIIWSDNQQVRGKHMKLFIKNSAPDYLHVERNAITVAQEPSDTSYFNQSSGDDLKAFFQQGKVKRIVIEGSAQSIYLPLDEHNEIVGLNRLENGDITLHMDNEGKVESIRVAPQPKGKFFPLSLVTEKDKFLSLFSWEQALRPSDPMDVFRAVSQANEAFVEDVSNASANRPRRASSSRRSRQSNHDDHSAHHH